MINIAFVIDTIESPTAGTEKQLLLLIKNLERSRFRPYLCVLQSSPWLRNEFSDCELYCAEIYSFKSWNGLLGLSRLRSFFRKRRMDIVQVHFRDASLAGIIAARLAGVRGIVATRRNQGYWMNDRELLLQRILNRWVASFVANSQATKAWAMEREGIPPQQIHVIYNGLDLTPFAVMKKDTAAEVWSEFALLPDSPVVGIVANLRPVKGHEVFLRAASMVLQQRDDVFFLLIGHGERRSALKAMATDLGIAGQVKFLGRQRDIPRIIAAMDVGVLSSHSESFSNAVLEYLAAGVPVVCTDVGGVREVIQDGENGHIVEPGNPAAMAKALLIILADPQRYSVAASRVWLHDNCSITCVVDRYEQLYAEICP